MTTPQLNLHPIWSRIELLEVINIHIPGKFSKLYFYLLVQNQISRFLYIFLTVCTRKKMIVMINC